MEEKSHRRHKTSSGHDAGIQSSSKFGERERELKRERDNELKSIAKNNLESSETVYRDKHGRKLDMVNEFMKQQTLAENKKAKVEKAQYEWGKGLKQKENEEEKRRELLEIADEPFARYIDDPKIDTMRKNELRDGDPMAQFFMQKSEKLEAAKESNTSSKQVNKKPLYKGPIPTPNRFGIRPGYRWDAIDRGIGYEHTLLTRINSKKSLKEDEYKWSVADL
eukprot:gene7379-10051_t